MRDSECIFKSLIAATLFLGFSCLHSMSLRRDNIAKVIATVRLDCQASSVCIVSGCIDVC